MSDVPDPRFFAWSNDADRIDAFVAALSALVEPDECCEVTLSTLGERHNLWRDGVSVNDLVALIWANFTSKSEVYVYVPVTKRSGGRINLLIQCYGAERGSIRVPIDPLVAQSGYSQICPSSLYVDLRSGERSVVVEASILSMNVQGDLEDLLGRFCALNDHRRLPTGGYTEGLFWGAPIELSATYNADGDIVRDLALSWLHLYDGNRVGYIAGIPLELVATRIEMAPIGATVGVSTGLTQLWKHATLEHGAAHHPATRGTHVGAIRRVPRDRLPGDVELTREQVLKVMETPPNTLLEALEAAAVPDDEWRAVEPLALEMIEAKKQGAPVVEVDVTSKKHRHFIEQHAPYHVRRLPNGGVMLATHPYRTLWPLWADALDLLGIRQNE
ncbi:MAG: hypothetical protein HUU21_41125 [Polyangiaceae bacterium]|nr:hypothetical protein [Polyangiaceae bacterium]